MSPLPLDDLPVARPAPVRSPAAARLARLTRLTLTLLPLLAIGTWAAVDWRAVSEGAARLVAADPRWLLAGVFFTCLGWVAAACVRQGALPERLPPGPLLASQFAAGAANHILPASIGAHAVTLRFLQRRGIPLARATASLALYSLVKPLAKTVVLVVFLVAFPDALRLGDLTPDTWTLLMAAGAAVLGLATAALLLTVVRPLRRPALGFVRTALTEARTLHTRPSRVLALWGGSAVAPVLQGSVIASVGFSLGLPLSWAQVVLALLLASTAVGAVPAPGGIGPVDAAMVLTMAAYGAPVSLATATVIGYRVLTVWIPLLPGALVLSALVHREVL
ncbi:lysylphosphatidylglycerol synthase transmembrane domain-containing protein [Streptomyces sp. Ag82_O1-15]|uniref:lysylphosphatidylglycerol synthase transmembrane domain-containing protein n=1 Tax=Streptomyces sp. Ag82_O1-15 TaxID=1938855 RepID=UPI00211CBA59|nr:lysylphosphatidylglycerol synthase transmembrane domain-containing protein [Streptomyces sp. Ag82_O1-15]